jgi:hypothetical protein
LVALHCTRLVLRMISLQFKFYDFNYLNKFEDAKCNSSN